MKILLSCLAMLFAVGASASDAEEAQDQAKPMTLRLYHLGKLASPLVSTTIEAGDNQSMFHTPAPAGGGGLGGGGGFFSVPAAPIGSPVVSQFGGGGSVQQPFNTNLMPYGEGSRSVSSHLMNLVVTHVSPESWKVNGGKATISAINEMLLIQQNEENHSKVAALIKQLQQHSVGSQPLSIELWWLPLNHAQRVDLKKQIAKDDAVAVLEELCESSSGYHGELQTYNRHTGRLRSGYVIPVIAGKVPVVGNGASGLQPIMAKLHVGLTADVTPRILEVKGKAVQLAVQTEMTRMKDFESTDFTGGEVDRYQLERHNLDANCTCQIGTPTIVGSLSVLGISTEADQQELVLVVEVTQ